MDLEAVVTLSLILSDAVTRGQIYLSVQVRGLRSRGYEEMKRAVKQRR